jgi:hypothetical protein
MKNYFLSLKKNLTEPESFPFQTLRCRSLKINEALVSEDGEMFRSRELALKFEN